MSINTLSPNIPYKSFIAITILSHLKTQKPIDIYSSVKLNKSCTENQKGRFLLRYRPFK